MADNCPSSSSCLLPSNGEPPNLYIAAVCPAYAEKIKEMEASELFCENSGNKESRDFLEDSYGVDNGVVGEFDALVEEDFMDERIYGATDHDELLCLEDYENLEGVGDDSSNEENHRFLPINPKEVQNIENGGRRRSKHSETWARKAFDSWRQFKKYDTSQSIEDLSEKNVKALVDLLHDFMLQVAKKNGELYPPRSLQGLLRALGRIIRSRIAANAVATSTRAESFNILKDPRYAKVKLAGDEAALRSIAAGLGKDVKRSDILTIAEERLMLSQEKCQITTPHGINLRFGYFGTRNFMIRGGQELRHTDAEDFSLHSDNYGEYLRYQQGTSKNWRFDINHCSVKDFRPAINCYIDDVVKTFKALMAHRPVFKVPPPHPLFLTPIHNVKTDRQKVWFMLKPVGHNLLAKISKRLTEDLPELTGKIITNKTGRGVAISRMSDALVPVEDGMKISGHRDPKSYGQYDQGKSDCKARAMQRCISGELLDGRPLMFEEAFAEEMERAKRMKILEASDDPLSSRDPNLMSVACTSTSTTNKEPMHIVFASKSNEKGKVSMQTDNDRNFSMIEIPTDVSEPIVNSKTSHDDLEVEFWNRKENLVALACHMEKFIRKPSEDDQEVDFWNSKENFSVLAQAMAQYDRTVSNVTNIAGHQFGNLTNCHITFNVSSSEVASTLQSLSSVQQDKP